MHIKRRDFIKMAGLSLGFNLINHSSILFANEKKPPLGRVVIIGGGYAGTTAAKYLRLWSLGSIEVVLIEPNQQFVSCPLSNLVLSGTKSIHDLTFGYDAVKNNYGVQWIQDTVVAIEPDRKKLRLSQGEVHYDRLIIAPGIDFIYDTLPMLKNIETQKQIPHAWKAGWQTVNLRQQIESMPNQGVFVMHVPRAPFRCPPGPYERACQVAYYLKNNKPQAKIILLDANAEIVAKKALFNKAFNGIYANLIEYHPNSILLDVDVATKTVKTEFETIRADVLNIIPPQRAGKPAQWLQLNNVNQRWCEVDFITYESKLIPDIHIIGDAVSANLPKSAHMASNQAKICANAIVQLMTGGAPDPAPVFANTCYSYVTNKSAMHVAHVYRFDATKGVMLPAEGGGISTQDSEEEGNYAAAWAQNIWADTLS